MSAGILHAHLWDKVDCQYFVSLNPTRDEISLYESTPNDKDNTPSKIFSKGDLESIQCYSYGPTDDGLVGAGQSNGIVNIFNLRIANSPVIKLKPKMSRPCNSISFSKSGLVAAGLDKVRNDNCLHVWNIEQYSRSYSAHSFSDDSFKTPLSTYLPNEVISSVCFLSDNPNILLCGSYKFIREIDIRSPTPIYQCAAKCSQGITVNLLNEVYFGSYSEDGAFSLWDRRQLKSSLGNNGEPVLYMNRLFGDSFRKNSLGCFRFSPTQSNEFTVLNDGNLLRRWQVGYTPTENIARNARIHPGTNRGADSQGPDILRQSTGKSDSIFVSSVLDSKTDYDRVASFDYTTDFSNNPNNTNFMCIRNSGVIFRMKVIESPDAVVFDPYNNVIVVEPERITLTASDGEIRKTSETEIARRESTTSELKVKDENNGEIADDDSEMLDGIEGILDPVSVLAGDISTVIRHRARKGYSLDCRRNLEVLDEDPRESYLNQVWRWLANAEELEFKKLMITDKLDMGYEGVLGIWEGCSGLVGQNRQLEADSITEVMFDETVKSLSEKTPQKPYISPTVANSIKVHHRIVCLKIAGWSFDIGELRDKLRELEANGKHEQAAGWAVFHGNVDRAVEALSRSKKERLRLMATAVAGYSAYRNSLENSQWRDQCRRFASELDDPYLRAIFAFIADGSWLDVLDEGSLPLIERLGIALRFLADDELITYLKRLADRAVAHGDLEGILLTGITPQLVPLLQSYVDKTCDVQTASLVVSFGSPRYFHDKRIKSWVEEYRSLLNSWRMFNSRATFDVMRRSLSKNHAGISTAKPVPKQIYLRCTHCKKAIEPSAMDDKASYFNKPHKEQVRRCQSCNNPLPRCAVCLQSLGTPITELQSKESSITQLRSQFDQWPTFCLSCNHGLHAGHAKEWFMKHDLCPVPDCNCLCNK